MEQYKRHFKSDLNSHYSAIHNRKVIDSIGHDWYHLPDHDNWPFGLYRIFNSLKNISKSIFSNQQHMKIWDRLLGNSSDFSIENRAFNAVSIVTMLLLILLVPLNVFMNLPVIAAIIFMLLMTQCGFYYFSRVKKMYKIPVILFSVLSYVTIITCYYFNSGIRGTSIYFFFLTLFLLMTITRKGLHWLWVTLHIVIALALFTYEYYNPSWITNAYQSKNDYFIDVASTYVLSLLFIFFIVNYLLSNYRFEKKLARERAAAIHEQNKQIVAQNIKLENLNKEKDKLLSIITHDFRGPLTSIQGYLELFAEFSMDKGEEDMKRELLNLTKNTSDMLLNLLVWSKHQMQGMVIQSKKVNVMEYVNQILSVQKTLARSKNIKINCAIDSHVFVYADVDMFQLVFRNLLHNAIKFSRNGEEINITHCIKDNECHICIEDHGIGIPFEKQEEVFKLKAKSTYGTGNEKGMSLGLSLCKEFIELQNGRIWFTSEPGKGSKFCIAIPLVK
ncbi:MAG: HAMP domain-containing sensor histidine kinase [Bacteroidota bacterium]